MNEIIDVDEFNKEHPIIFVKIMDVEIHSGRWYAESKGSTFKVIQTRDGFMLVDDKAPSIRCIDAEHCEVLD
jgi:hypothetical protein